MSHRIKSVASAVLMALVASALVAGMESPSLNDAQIAHIAVTADDIDIAYAHLALALSANPRIREFAETMVSDHTAVNSKAATLAGELGLTPEDNSVSRQLREQARAKIEELSRLRGAEFDVAYATNELAYHRAVNGVLRDTLIPGTSNPRLKQLLESAVPVFLAHEKHAEKLNAVVVARGRR